MSKVDDLKLLYKDAEARGDRDLADRVLLKLDEEASKTTSKSPDISRAFNLGMKGMGPNPIDFATGLIYGAGKGTLDLYEGAKQGILGMMGGDAQQNYTKETDPVRADRESFLRSQPTGFQMGSGVGEFGSKVAPAMLLKNPQTALGRIFLGTNVGGAYGFSDYISEAEKNSGESRPVNTLVSATFGGGIPAAFEVANKIRNFGANVIRKKMKTALGEEGQMLEDATGVPLTFGQKTGDPFLSQLESGISKTNQTIAEKNKALNTVTESLLKPVKGVEGRPEIVAKNVSNAIDDAVDAAREFRRKQASYDYATFKRATGGEAVIQTANTQKELANIADEYKFSPADMRGWLRFLTRNVKEGEHLTADQFLNMRSRVSDSLAGTGNLFKDIDRAVEKRLAARVMNAMESDISATSQYLGSSGNQTAADLLKKASTNYSKNSSAIREIEESTLGRIFKTDTFTPEKAASAMNKMQPSEVRSAFAILNKRSPQQADEIASLWLHDAIRGSMGAPGKLASEATLDTTKLVNTLLDPKSGGAMKLRAMFPDPEKRGQVIRSIRVLQRLSDSVNPGTGGSQSVTSRGADVARNVFSLNTIFGAGLLAKILTPIGIRKTLLTEAGRKNLIALTDPVKNQAAYVAATRYFARELKGEILGRIDEQFQENQAETGQ